MALNPVQAWLHSVLGPYRNAQEVYADVDRTLRAVPTLSPRTDTYTYDDGRTALLLTLGGTIPINFRGATYNIPIAYWIPHDYPKEPPIAYVVPNSSMLVRPSRNVDNSGLCKPEMLEAWSRKSEGCNLLLLTETLQAIFSREPPLYAKPSPAQHQSQPPPSPSSSAGPSISRQGSQFRPPPAPPSPSSASPASQQPPPRPYHPNSRQASSSQSPSLPVKPPVMNGFHASTSRPAQNAGPPQLHSAKPQIYTDSRPSSIPPSPVGQSPYGHYRPPDQYQYQQTQPSAAGQHYQSSVQPPHNHSQHAANQQAGPSNPQGGPLRPPRPDSLRPGSSVAQHSRSFSTPVNILDSDDQEPSAGLAAGPPPPRPVNPEMLNMRRALYAQLTYHLSSLSAHYEAENSQLYALHQDLLKGEPAIQDEMARLEAVRDVCTSVRDRMQEVVHTGERNLEDLKHRPDPEVDELVCGTSVVHNQLLELVAEDNALEDTVYHLGRVFNADARTPEELERFLKRTRALCREQFFKRSLINKILLELALARAQR